MARRVTQAQSEHDAAVRAARDIYVRHRRGVWINPDGEKNKAWSGRYIDVIAATNAAQDRAWVIEVETAESVDDDEAKTQWKDYDSAYQERWFLAVPTESKAKAQQLLTRHGIAHCTVITWTRNGDGTHTYWGLPGLN